MVLEYLTKKEPKLQLQEIITIRKQTAVLISYVSLNYQPLWHNPVLNTYLRIENVRLDLIYLENYKIETV